MECNKEEGIRAKEIAEKMMQNKDFIGARKFTVKAQKLFPQLENISQLSTVCEVHCAASVKINGMIDWYGILQLEATADESSIKRQYRKLALLLHPDKNKFAGAEAAFKLIGEAHMTLKDQWKRSVYDQKRTGLIKNAPPRQSSNHPKGTDSHRAGASTNFNGLNHHQQPPSFPGSQTFWTKCRSCGLQYQYHRDILNKLIRCLSCLQPFVACEVTEPTMPRVVKSNTGMGTGIPQRDHVSSQPKGFRKSACNFVGNVGAGHGINSKRHVDGSLERENKDGKTKAEGAAASGDVRIEKKHAEVNKREKESDSSKLSTHGSQKRGRKVVIDSPVVQNAGGTATQYPRRSPRKKQNVTDNENADNDNEFPSSPCNSRKRHRKGASSSHPHAIDETITTGAGPEINSRHADGSSERENKDGKAEAEGAASGDVKIEEKHAEANKKEQEPDPTMTDPSKLSTRGNQKKGERVVVDSRDSDSADGVDLVMEDDSPAAQSAGGTATQYPRRSARKKHNVTSNDNVNNDYEFSSSPCSSRKRPRKGASSSHPDEIDEKINTGAGPGTDSRHADGSLERENKDGKTEAEGAASGDVKIEEKHAKVNKREEETEPMMMDSSKFSTHGSQKRGRRVVIDSFDLDSTDGEYLVMKDGSAAVQNAGGTATQYPQRSVRKKQNVTSSENANNDREFSSSPSSSRKSPRKDTSSHPDGIDKKISDGDFNGGNRETPETDFPSNTDKKQNGSFLPCLVNEQVIEDSLHEDSQGVDQKKDVSRADRDTGSESLSKESPDLGAYSYPDPEFCDFEKYRDMSQFAVDQIWALYDNFDAMPRFYARIRHVSGPEFEVRFTWLEHDPVTQPEISWSDEELPVACGNFKLGKSQTSQDRLMFSHVISWEKSRKANRYYIYPRKGEVWALYKGWDIGWSSDADNHRMYEYDLVEVISEFIVKNGITVVPLVKIKGFVSLFMQVKDAAPYTIPAGEILRFSHAVPFYRMNGTEREGIPRGCFELDSVSLPCNFHEAFPSVTLDDHEPEARKLENERNDSSLHNATDREKFETSEISERKKLKDQSLSSAKNHKQRLVENEIKASSEDFDMRHTVGACGNHAHGDDKYDISSQPSSLSCNDYLYPVPEFYNFHEAISCDKFQRGQVWALYSDVDQLPKYYGLIRKIELDKFRVHALYLEARPCLEEEKRWVREEFPIGCGTFQISKESITFDDAEAFSHLVQARKFGKRCRFEILPCNGEIWAIYRNWRVGWSLSDIKKSEYDIVEILERTDVGTKFSVLKKVDGYKAVFMPDATGTMEMIPMGEYLRFSHRIPAYRLTEVDARLRGYWELDPASVPEVFLSANT